MSSERPFGDSGTEHHPELNHPRPTEEATAAVPTPNRFWRMMTDPGFPSPASNLAPFMVTTEAFLDQSGPSTSGNGADHNLIPTPARAFNGSPIGSPGDTPPNGVTDGPRSGNLARRRGATASIHQRLDEVQKEVLKSREEVEESSKGGSPFTPEIQSKPLPAAFRLPTLEPYDGSGDPTEHIATFRAQMALYDTSEALMCRAFPTTLRGSAKTCDEPLSQFVGRFTSQVQGIPDLHPSLVIQAFLTGLRPSRFFWLLIERSPTTLPEMLQRAHQYMAAETLIADKREEMKHPRTTGPPTWSTQHGKLVGCRDQRSTRVGILPLDPSSTILAADFRSRTLSLHPSGRTPTPYREDRR
ncbi:hypothetical protein B296_00015719 [Ensete ventricosum]|uniref:Retrotransposon gag domain-containing protein n=1 Tax=Ensete ventricosum TaxID=4639 RepID=A0A426YTF5_ENSVE|nr:hypothetical protein B296_00015719 [Ensete ventricosum]